MKSDFIILPVLVPILFASMGCEKRTVVSPLSISRLDGTGTESAVNPRPEDLSVWNSYADVRVPAKTRIDSSNPAVQVRGVNLDKVTKAVLIGRTGQGIYEMPIMEETPMTMKLGWPATLTAGGLFILSLQSSAGNASAQVYFLQGENGPPAYQVCEPDKKFCKSDKLLTCGSFGYDAILSEDCPSKGTVTNPSHCRTKDECPNNESCCMRDKPSCVWAIDKPIQESGSISGDSAMPLCHASAGAGSSSADAGTCAEASSFVFMNSYTGRNCEQDTLLISISLDKSKPGIKPGQVITLPADGVSFFAIAGLLKLQGLDSQICQDWGGTINWVSDIPSFHFVINARCKDKGKEDMEVAGDFKGDL